MDLVALRHYIKCRARMEQMLSRARLGAALAIMAVAGPASAATWGVGVGVGYAPPIYYDAPPRVFYGAPLVGPPPELYQAPPGVYYRNAPVAVEQGVPVLHMEAIEDVEARLSEEGYRPLGR